MKQNMKENDKEQELIAQKKRSEEYRERAAPQQGVVCTIYARVISSF